MGPRPLSSCLTATKGARHLPHNAMICRKCNHEYPDTMDMCPICGEPNAGEQTARPSEGPSEPKYSAPVPPQYAPAPPAVITETKKNAGTPLILGILSLTIPAVGLVLAILAIIFGVGTKRDYLKNSPEYTMANVGFILGIIALAIQALMIIYIVAVFGWVTSMMQDLIAYSYSYSGTPSFGSGAEYIPFIG